MGKASEGEQVKGAAGGIRGIRDTKPGKNTHEMNWNEFRNTQ